jgi:hypothetical protein
MVRLQKEFNRILAQNAAGCNEYPGGNKIPEKLSRKSLTAPQGHRLQ